MYKSETSDDDYEVFESKESRTTNPVDQEELVRKFTFHKEPMICEHCYKVNTVDHTPYKRRKTRSHQIALDEPTFRRLNHEIEDYANYNIGFQHIFRQLDKIRDREAEFHNIKIK